MPYGRLPGRIELFRERLGHYCASLTWDDMPGLAAARPTSTGIRDRPTSFDLITLDNSWRARGSRLAALHNPPLMVGGEHGDVSNRVFLVLAVGREVPEVGNASDEAAVVLAIDHRPGPDPIHALLPIPQNDGSETIGGDATARLRWRTRQSQNLTH